MPALRVLLVDDHALFREGVGMLLQRLGSPIEIAEAGNCEDALSLLQAGGAEPFDLALVDLNMPGLSGMDAIGLMRVASPDLLVVVMSSDDEPAVVFKALDRGAVGFIPKSSTSPVMLEALRTVLARRIYLPPHVVEAPITARLAAVPAAMQAGARLDDLGLTQRQCEVLQCILLGKSTKLICRDLGLSEGTVKTHTSAVLRALNVTTRTQAVLAASRLGLRLG